MAAKSTPTTILSLNDDMICRTKVLDFDKIAGCPLTLLQARTIAQHVGPHVHTLKASKCSFSIKTRTAPISVLKYCKNLQKIFLFDLRMTDEASLRNLSDMFGKIKEVHLVDSNFFDDIGECLRKSSQLEVIRFTNNREITGQCLVGLQGIKEINLRNCEKLQPQFFKEFISANLQLRKLNISGCPKIDTSCLSLIATKLTNLESLEIDDQFPATLEAYCALATLPSLTKIKIWNAMNTFRVLVQTKGLLLKLSAHDRLHELRVHGMELATCDIVALVRFTKLRILELSSVTLMMDNILLELSCKNTLEELNISSCATVTPHGVLECVKRFKCLKKLDISRCYQFTMEFLRNLARQLDRKLEIVAKISYFSSKACDQNELQELLELVQDKIELKYKRRFKVDEEYPRERDYIWIPDDQIVFE